MSVYKNIIQGLTKAEEYQKGKIVHDDPGFIKRFQVKA